MHIKKTFKNKPEKLFSLSVFKMSQKGGKYANTIG